VSKGDDFGDYYEFMQSEVSKGDDFGDYYEFMQSEVSKGDDFGDFYAPQGHFHVLVVITPQYIRSTTGAFPCIGRYHSSIH
jgi:hypothetical protein